MSAAAKVLVVDDTPANISLMLDALSDAGYDVLVAESAASAFALLEHNAPDLILLDVLMPGVNGFDACVRLKADARWSEIPVLFMTALDDGSEKVRAFTAGAVDYITKPVHPPEVLARVGTHLQIRALQRSLADELAMRVEAENQLSQSLDRAVLLVDAHGHVTFSTRRAETLLHRHFSDYTPGALPSALYSDESPLEVHRFAEPGRGDYLLLVLEEKRATPGPGALLPLGLTPREAEVLYWIAQGKSNPDIATILSASVRTVHKHVENIFRKLGCETRAAAGLTAAELLRAR